ncbi:MAG: hypothetical protein AAGF93_10540 [Cyanobacteria bacterium P01_H01_bin.105]
MSGPAHAKSNVPSKQAVPQVEKQQEQELVATTTTHSFGDAESEDAPLNRAGSRDIQTQLNQAAVFGHSFGQLGAPDNSVSTMQLKRSEDAPVTQLQFDHSTPIQKQGYGYEDEEQMMSVWNDRSADMTSPDAPMSIAVSTPRSSASNSSSKTNKDSSWVKNSFSNTFNEFIGESTASKVWEHTKNANGAVSTLTTLTQSLGDATLFGTIYPGVDPFADLLWNAPMADDLIGLAGTASDHGVASRTGKLIKGLGHGANALGVVMGGADAYDAHQRGDASAIVQGTSDAVASGIGFLGPKGAAFSGGYAGGQLLDQLTGTAMNVTGLSDLLDQQRGITRPEDQYGDYSLSGMASNKMVERDQEISPMLLSMLGLYDETKPAYTQTIGWKLADALGI